MRRYLIVVEKAAGSFSAYSPDLPGCVATGQAADEARCRMREAIELHLEGLREAHVPIPAPSTVAFTVEVGQP